MKNNSSNYFATFDPHRCSAKALYCFVSNLYKSKTIQYIDFKQHFFYLFGNPLFFSFTGGGKPYFFFEYFLPAVELSLQLGFSKLFFVMFPT